MSIRLMSAIFESETLGPTERLVMLALADHADDDGRCYPSIARLCQRTGLSERAVQTNIRKLVDQGYIRIVLGGGKGNSNLYFISANPAADAPRRKCTPAADAPQTPQEMRPNPAADAPEPSRTTIEPSEDPPLPPQTEDVPSKRRRACALPADWVPSERNIADAHSRNFTDQEIRHEAERFRDYHLAKGTTFKDWDAGWRTWLGNARKFATSRAMARGSQHGGGQPVGGLVGAAMRSSAARGH